MSVCLPAGIQNFHTVYVRMQCRRLFSTFTIKNEMTSSNANTVFLSFQMSELRLSQVHNVDHMVCLMRLFSPSVVFYSNCFWSFRPPSHGWIQSADTRTCTHAHMHECTHTNTLTGHFTEHTTVRLLWGPCWCGSLLCGNSDQRHFWLAVLARCHVNGPTCRTGQRPAGDDRGYNVPVTVAPPKTRSHVSGWFVVVIHKACAHSCLN